MPGTVESARLSAASHAAASGVAIIGAEALMGLGENAVVVDVRTLAERLVARIPRSYSAADFEAADPEICRNKTVVVVCTVGRRSGAYAARLLDRGGVWNAVLNSEGIVSYSHAEAAYGSGPFALVDAAGQPANALHCYAARGCVRRRARREVLSLGAVGPRESALQGSALRARGSRPRRGVARAPRPVLPITRHDFFSRARTHRASSTGERAPIAKPGKSASLARLFYPEENASFRSADPISQP